MTPPHRNLLDTSTIYLGDNPSSHALRVWSSLTVTDYIHTGRRLTLRLRLSPLCCFPHTLLTPRPSVNFPFLAQCNAKCMYVAATDAYMQCQTHGKTCTLSTALVRVICICLVPNLTLYLRLERHPRLHHSTPHCTPPPRTTQPIPLSHDPH